MECFRLALTTVNPLLLRSSVACFETFLRRLRAQYPTWLKFRVPMLKNLVIDHIASRDLQKRVLNILIDLWHFNPSEIEKSLIHLSTTSKSAETRIQCFKWFVLAHNAHLSFDVKSLRPALYINLENANPSVREEAKEVLLLIYKNLSTSAKMQFITDVETTSGLRREILQSLVEELSLILSSSEVKLVQNSASSFQPAPFMTAVATLYPGVELENVKPLLANFSKQLEQDSASMLPAFEGRETEQNWSVRQDSVLRLRQYLRGNACIDYLPELLSVLKTLLPGILLALLSLRTTLSSSAIQLIKEMAIILKSNIDPFLELILPNLLKVCSVTKKLASQAANVTFAAILVNCGVLSRNLSFISLAAHDTNAQLRVFSSNWIFMLISLSPELKNLASLQTNLKAFEKLICRGLADSNSQVREVYRKSFWKLSEYFPSVQEELTNTLEPSVLKQLHLANPNRQAASFNFSGPKRAPIRPLSNLRSFSKSQKEETSSNSSNSSGTRRLGLPQRATPASRERVLPYTRSQAFHSTSLPPSLPSGHSPSIAVPSKRSVSATIKDESKTFELLKNIQRKYESILSGSSVDLPSAEFLSSNLTDALYSGSSICYSLIFSHSLLDLTFQYVDIASLLSQFLLCVYDPSNVGHSFALASFPYVKSHYDAHEYFPIVFDVLMNISNMAPHVKVFPFNTNQKRLIIHGCLLWLKEISDTKLNQLENKPFFVTDKLRYYSSKILAMTAKTKLTSKNWIPLSGLLFSLRAHDTFMFDGLLDRLNEESRTKLVSSWSKQDAFDYSKSSTHQEHLSKNLPTLNTSSSSNSSQTDLLVPHGKGETKETEMQSPIESKEGLLSKDTHIESPQGTSLEKENEEEGKNPVESNCSEESLDDHNIDQTLVNKKETLAQDSESLLQKNNALNEKGFENQFGLSSSAAKVLNKDTLDHVSGPISNSVSSSFKDFTRTPFKEINGERETGFELTSYVNALSKKDDINVQKTENVDESVGLNAMFMDNVNQDSLNSVDQSSGKDKLLLTSSTPNKPTTFFMPANEEILGSPAKDYNIHDQSYSVHELHSENMRENVGQSSLIYNNRDYMNTPMNDFSLSFSEIKGGILESPVESPMTGTISPIDADESVLHDIPAYESLNKSESNKYQEQAYSTPLHHTLNVLPKNKWILSRMHKMENGSPINVDKNLDDAVAALEAAVKELNDGSVNTKTLKFCIKVCKETPSMLYHSHGLLPAILHYIESNNSAMHISDCLILLHEFLVQGYQGVDMHTYHNIICILIEKAEKCKDEPVILAGIEDNITLIAEIADLQGLYEFTQQRLQSLNTETGEKSAPLLLMLLSAILMRLKDLEFLETKDLLRHVVLKYIDHTNPEIRKATFNVCLAVNTIVNNVDETFSILGGLNEGQRLLFMHYLKMKSDEKN